MFTVISHPRAFPGYWDYVSKITHISHSFSNAHLSPLTFKSTIFNHDLWGNYGNTHQYMCEMGRFHKYNVCLSHCTVHNLDIRLLVQSWTKGFNIIWISGELFSRLYHYFVQFLCEYLHSVITMDSS